jgi:hypothetical protein
MISLVVPVSPYNTETCHRVRSGATTQDNQRRIVALV